MDLNLFWFILLGVLLAGYAILDGFDFGVGMLLWSAKKDKERRILFNSIGPLWDGNEVWLVTFGGALFAAFPHAYATAFSGFYLAFMLLLFALIMRAVSIEFRSKIEHQAWRSFWDFMFSFASFLAPLLFGVAVGNSIKGLPIDETMELSISFFALLAPYPILVGLFTVAAFALHGALFLYLKTEGDLQSRLSRWIWHCFGIFLVLYLATTIATLVSVERATMNFEEHPWGWGIVVINILAIANIPRSVFMKRPGWAFVSSCVSLVTFAGLFGFALFPNLMVSSLNPEWSLSIYNAASSQKTLGIMRLIAFLGLPFVLSYTAAVYWVFRGKVKLGEFSY